MTFFTALLDRLALHRRHPGLIDRISWYSTAAR